MPMDFQLANIFTKLPNEDRFNFIRQKLGMLNIDACIEEEPSFETNSVLEVNYEDR